MTSLFLANTRKVTPEERDKLVEKAMHSGSEKTFSLVLNHKFSKDQNLSNVKKRKMLDPPSKGSNFSFL